MAFQNATGTRIQDSAFYDIGGNQFNIGQIVQMNGGLVQKRAPPLKNCPSPTNLFTGRSDVLQQLHKCFPPLSTSVESAQQCRFVLYGLGGGGKTQIMIAFKFVKECLMGTQPHRFLDVFFIDATTAQTIDTNLKNITLGKEIGENTNDTIIWLARKHQDWLLLFDNADDTMLNLSRFFPSCSHGNILITTQNRDTLIHALGFNYNVGSLALEDARDLLLGIIKQVITDETCVLAESIIKTLQAGAYILMSGNISGYLDNYKKHCTKLLREHGRQRVDGYEWMVYTTWQISFEKLSSKAATFLQLCAFMHHDGIAEETFRKATAMSFKKIPSSATDFLCNFPDVNQEWDTTCFLDMTNELWRYSLIDFEHVNKIFSIHPLMHTWMHDAHMNGEIT
ncbi:hypothetical protein L208DRAFT_1409724 [Tricholoma matsutake]|nr:hypothetical protein L208DRAFT_1409724 [Tricholoma matsutake 945]